jgi:hypothetical protein
MKETENKVVLLNNDLEKESQANKLFNETKQTEGLCFCSIQF